MANPDPAELAKKIFIYTIVGAVLCYAAALWILL